MDALRRYQVAEIFASIQGEGLHQGRPAVFLRLAGCNAWDGRSATRAASACPSCDTDFRLREALTLRQITTRLTALRPRSRGARAGWGCVLTGGEPLLQADAALLAALGRVFAWVDVETNGTRPCPRRPRNVFIACSPKAIAGQPLRLTTPDWWKILIPDQQAFLPRALRSHRPVFAQPVCPPGGLRSPAYRANLAACLRLCREYDVRLGVQLHKYLGLV